MATSITDERDWLRRLGLGDEAAWSDLYRAHQGRIYRFAWHMCGIASVADEVTQETFLAFLKEHRRFDPERGTLAAWLVGIARRQVLKALRGRRNEAELTDVGVEAVWDDGDLRSLRRVVLNLPEPYREAIVLCELQELSYEEAAKAMNCPVGTVRSRLSRARQMLTERMTRRPNGKTMRATSQISGTKECLTDNTE
jgi:RNA polymerase sigma-70 factor (ECF subfamily)